LARAEASGPGQLDPALRFAVPTDGTYTVKIQDRFSTRGGPNFAYRLRVDRPQSPDFRIGLVTDMVTLPREDPAAAPKAPKKGQARLKVTAERLAGFKEPIE